MNIGKSLKIAMVKQNLDQSGLAEKLGIHKTSVSRMANNHGINCETLSRLATAFGMKVSEFVALGED
ncbi:helix-turn-helix protein [compost metagenome]